MPEYTALEIDMPKIHDILIALDPTFMELDYENDLHQKFIVFDFPKKGQHAIIDPSSFKAMTITPGAKLKLVQIHFDN